MLSRLPRSPASPPRRGSVALVAAVAITVLMAFGALAVDVAYLRLAQAQLQDTADAASVAALWAARAEDSAAAADAAAAALVARNEVVGRAATIESVELGDWDRRDDGFDLDLVSPNSARVQLSLAESGGVPMFLARILGWEAVPISARATAASRDLHVILVMDITNSWSRSNYHKAREAAVAFLDVLERAHGPSDRIGMTIFTGRYAWEFTPLTLLDDVAGLGVRPTWAAMETASKAGVQKSWGCAVHGGSQRDDFSAPAGGCYPQMPREYSDEPGTDHSTGIEMARLMFEEDDDDGVYRAMVVLTDGRPNGIYSGHGSTRQSRGDDELRWREWLGPVPHSSSDIQSDTVALTAQLWDELEVHTWVVSFDADERFLSEMPQGEGSYVLTSDPGALVGIFEDIASSLPLAVVQ